MGENHRPELLVLIGIPGSGKSTFARRMQAARPSLRIISPDTIRERLYPGYEAGLVPHREINHRRVFAIAYRDVEDALTEGQDVLFDATSLTETRRGKLVRLGQAAGARVVAHYFPISLHEAIRRNQGRARRVPHGIMAHMASILRPPRVEEGFDRIVVHPQRNAGGDTERGERVA